MMSMKRVPVCFVVLMYMAGSAFAGGIEAVSFTDVTIADEFWAGRIETNR